MRLLFLLAGVSTLAISNANALDAAGDEIVVTGRHDVVEARPNTVISRDADQIRATTNVLNAEDSLRYFPSILARKRHVGDTQAPIATRTSGVGASARSLIYADGVLLSALIGNNNSTASPKWGMVAPGEIASVDVVYGPFSAAYPGNSIGAVVEIATRAPDKFEASLGAVGSLQHFEQYATSGDYGARQFSAAIGDRLGPFTLRFAAQQTISDSQPLAYVTVARPAAASSVGTALIGAFDTFNRTGAPIAVLGAGGLEHQVQDNLSLRASLDLSPRTTLGFTVGRFGNETDAGVESYMRDASRQAAYAGGPYNIGGFAYTIPTTAFSNNIYRFDEEQWMQALTLNHRGDTVDWRIVASQYDYAQSQQRTPSAALPGAFAGGAGTITKFDGTGWRTLDGKLIWRIASHEFSFGAHGDQYDLANNRYNTADWRQGDAGALAAAARGRTETVALWAQDAWKITPALALTAGLRWESWRASDGLNFSLSPALNAVQPTLDARKASPKASLEWTPAPDWRARVSIGRAYRFPTVSELYQAITTGAVLTVPNPSLRPEKALSAEWSLARHFSDGDVRVSLFSEDIEDALISQSAPLAPGSSTLFNYVQNVDKVESRGVELVVERNNVLVEGLSLSGSATYLHARTVRDAAFPAAVGKQTPQTPVWRATVIATYRPDNRWAFTLAGRYSDRVYATIDNSDVVSHTFQGFEHYFVVDARAALKLSDHWDAAVSIENLGNADYFLFHPFPQRALAGELRYRF